MNVLETHSPDFVEILALEIVAGVIVAILLAVWAGIWTKAREFARRHHRVLVFVSAGGTCRDPMAKAITQQLLVGQKLKTPIDVHAVGLVPDGSNASFAARQVIREKYGKDLLRRHKPKSMTRQLANKADLILVMDQALMKATENTFPQDKTHLFKAFFKLNGDISDPYRDKGARDPETIARYQACAAEIEQILAAHMNQLLTALDAV
jgi:protein-tyrosine-phosphatase